MIIEQQRELVYRCPECDRFHQISVSLFDLPKNQVLIHRCQCGQSRITVIFTGKGYFVTVPCAICREVHRYRIEKRAFWRAPLYPMECTRVAIEIGAVGLAQPVEEWKVSFEEMLAQLYGPEPPLKGAPPYEFCNSRVMLACMEHLKALADQGEIACRCGSRHMDLEVERDRLLLICPGCGAQYTVKAATPADGDAFLQVTHIDLNTKRSGAGGLHLVT